MAIAERDEAVYGPSTPQALQAHFCPLPETNWTRRAYHASIVVGDFIYIDGGEVALGQKPYPFDGSSFSDVSFNLVALNVSLSLPLANSWTPDTVRFNVIIKPPMPLWNFQSLWYDEAQNEVYPFGGEISSLHSSPPDLTVWKFKPLSSGGASNAVWSVNSTEQSAPWSLGITRPLGGAAVSTKDTAFLLGGYSSSNSSPRTSSLTGFVPTPGMVMYHFGNGTWGNFTETPGFSDSGAIEWPGMIKAPFGPNGLVVVFGGETSDLTSYTPGEKERWMTKITLFDPVTLQFYRQTASGDQIPSPRNRFCVAGASDTSKTSGGNSTGSYEIFIYGGYGGIWGPGAEQYDEIWVLTLPAFQWLKVDSSHLSARVGHTCHVVGNSQLLSIGGVDAAQTDPWSTVDHAFQGLGTFDLNNWNWTKSYNASAPKYKRNNALGHYYKDNGPYPRNWDKPELRDLIMYNRTTLSSSTTTSASSQPTTTPSSSASSRSGLSTYQRTALIFGSVIGGVILLILAFTCIFFRRRRNRNRSRRRQRQRWGEQHSGNELAGQDSKFELPPGPKVARGPYKPRPRRVVAELAAEEVAMEKGAGGEEGRSPVVEAPAPGRVAVGGRERVRGWGWGMSPLREKRSVSSSDTMVGTQVVPVIRVKGEGEEEEWSPSRFKEHATPRGSSYFY